jgi:hypothetical protein
MNVNVKFIIFIVIAVAIAAIAFFIPDLASADLTGTVVFTVISSIALLGAVWYFIGSLKAFKPSLRRAYYMLAAGIALYSLVLLQLFIVLFTGLEDPLVRSLLFLVPYFASALLAYMAVRTFARLLEVKNIWTSLLFVAGIATVVAFLATLLPMPSQESSGIDPTTLDILTFVLTWNVIFSISAGIVSLYVRHVISPTYKNAMSWLAVALFALGFGVLHEFIIKTYFYDTAYVASDLSAWPFILSGVLFLRAGLAFRATQLRNFQIAEDASDIDIVLATANLVSKPTAIDKELDKVRAITARASSPEKLSANDEATLENVYLYLEDYLITREPFSNFTKEALRNNLPDSFTSRLSK